MKVLFLFLISLLFFSCEGGKTSFGTEEEFQAYLNNPDNGFIQSATIGDFIWSAKLTPTTTKDINNEVSFSLRIEKTDGGSVLDHGSVPKEVAMTREGVLAFDVKNMVFLECNDQIIPCSFHHYERNYGLKPSVDLLFHFNNVSPKQDVNFVFRDELFDQGLVRIKFNKDLFKKYDVQKK